MKRFLLGLLAYGLAISPAAAGSTTFTLATGIGPGTATYQGWLCSAVICTGSVPQNSSGLELFTTGNPGNVALTDGADMTLGSKSDGIWSSGSGSLISIAKAIATNTSSAVPAGGNVIGGVNPGTASLWGIVTQGSTTSGQSGELVQGAVTTSAPSYTTAQTSPISLDTSGNIRVNCTTGCSSSGGSSLADEGTFTQGTTSFTVGGCFFANSITNLTTGQGGAFQCTNDRQLFVNLGKVGGTAVVTGGVNGTVGVGGLAATGAVLAGNPVLIAGSDGTDARNIATNSSGQPVVVGAGVAGTPAGGVVSVQGVASGTNLNVAQGTASALNATIVGSGSAGTAATGVVTVQGIAAMTPIAENLSQVGGTTVSTGTGAVGSGSQRVAVAEDTNTIAGSAVGTAGSASANVVTVQGVSSMTPVLVTPSATADPCMSAAKTNFALASSSGNTQVVGGSSSKKVYICSISVIAATAAVINFIEGTGAA